MILIWSPDFYENLRFYSNKEIRSFPLRDNERLILEYYSSSEESYD